MSEICSIEQFRHFFLAKAFDIIGCGTFKKHLAKCKEANDPWAIAMCNNITKMQQVLNNLQNEIKEIPNSPCKMFEICKDVMCSAQPPVKMFAGATTCALTGNVCVHCLDLSKIYKVPQNTYVDASFGTFFVFLWYANKIEHVIRSYIRNWLDNQKKEQNYTVLCEMIQKDLDDTILKMHKLFNRAYSHVMISVRRFIEVQNRRSIVQK
jgi:hypothetical protein